MNGAMMRLLAMVFWASIPSAALSVTVLPGYEATVFASGIPKPLGMAFGPGGDLFVAAGGADAVLRIAPDGSTTTFASSCQDPLDFMVGYPTKMAFGPDGFLYVGAVGAYDNACNRNGDVLDQFYRISPAGVISVAASGTGCCNDPFDDPSGVAAGPDGKVYFTDTWFGQGVFRYDPTTGGLERWTTVPYPWNGGQAMPYAAVFDAGGGLLVALPGLARIDRIAPDGTFQPFATGLGATALRFSPSGQLFATDGTDVFRREPDGTFAPFAFGFSSAFDLAFDAAGALYVSEMGADDIIRIAPAVIAVAIDIKPGSFPNSINLGSNGVVPVAILSSATFDARTVDPASVALAGTAVALKGRGTLMAGFEDVNGDGLVDLVVHVTTQALQLTATDSLAVLTGRTFSGRLVRGADTVRIVP